MCIRDSRNYMRTWLPFVDNLKSVADEENFLKGVLSAPADSYEPISVSYTHLLKHNLRPMLELESGSNDPMAYMLTVVLIQLIQSSGMGCLLYTSRCV